MVAADGLLVGGRRLEEEAAAAAGEEEEEEGLLLCSCFSFSPVVARLALMLDSRRSRRDVVLVLVLRPGGGASIVNGACLRGFSFPT